MDDLTVLTMLPHYVRKAEPVLVWAVLQDGRNWTQLPKHGRQSQTSSLKDALWKDPLKSETFCDSEQNLL